MPYHPEIERTTKFASCHVNGWHLWEQELNWLASRLWNLSLNNFTIFDVREFDSFADARNALVQMYQAKLFTSNPPEPTYTLINVKSGERRSGTVEELKRAFRYTTRSPLLNLIDGHQPKGGRLKNWILFN